MKQPPCGQLAPNLSPKDISKTLYSMDFHSLHMDDEYQVLQD